MSSPVLLAIDQGTTSSRAVVYNAVTFEPLGVAQQEIEQHYPADGWVEHEPEDIWYSVARTVREALAKSGRDPRPRGRAWGSPISAKRWSRGTAPTGQHRPRRHRVAGPPHHRILPRTRRGPVLAHRAHGIGTRSVLFRHEGAVASGSDAARESARGARRGEVRHGRFVPHLAAHRRREPRHRFEQRLAHAAVQHSHASVGRRTAPVLRCHAGRARRM